MVTIESPNERPTARASTIRARRMAWMALLAMVVVTSPAFGYVIFLKDGNQIIAQDKYRVEGDQALFELQSGVTSSIPFADIDVERTEEANQVALRGVQVIEGLEAVDLANATPPPPPRESITDLLQRRSANERGLRVPEPTSRDPEDAAAGSSEPGVPTTPAGYVDLARLPRRPYPEPQVSETLTQFLEGRGVGTLGVFEGSAANQPFIELLATSESAVWKALKESADALLQARAAHPGEVVALEVLLVSRTENRSADDYGRAGQFQLTPELAELLTAGSIAPSSFFLRYVEF